jgi:hypoxanthine phosphoribosyltransferase
LATFRYVSWTEYGKLVEKLAKKIFASGTSYDLVVGIARGGIPVAMVISDRLGTKVDIVNVKSYTGIAERLKPKILSTLTEHITAKSLLLVDDLVDGGDTMETVTEFLGLETPMKVTTAVIFKKPWSKFEPDFFVETVDEWVVFPWERGEVERFRK